MRGQAVDSQLACKRIPPAWTDAATDLDKDLPRNTRAVVLPGQLFASTMGATVDPLLPALSDRPVAARYGPGPTATAAVDLLWAVDGLVQQERTVRGQLPPLLALLGAGAVVTGSDDNRARSGAIVPAGAARQLALGGLGAPDRTYGRPRAAPVEAGTIGPRLRVPEVARRDLAAGPGIVRVLPRAPQTLVDGSAETLTGLAALGGLDPDRPLAYAADRTTEELRAAARSGADVVIGDGNRRRVIVASRARQEVGPTLTAGDAIPADAAVLDPLEAGTRAQTVAEYDGIRSVREDPLPGVTQFPEHRPFAAIDGDPSTSWIAPGHVDFERNWLEVEFTAPRNVPYVDLLPHADSLGRTAQVEIAGRRYDVKPGWNRLRTDLHGAAKLRVLISRVERAPGVSRGDSGIDELRIPGVHAREWLRPPRVLEDALRGEDLARSSLSYVFERTTGATPFRRDVATGAPQARLVRDRGDAETQIGRRITPPAARRYQADGWATISTSAPDPALDALAGTHGGPFASSGRFEGNAGRRASRAFDGDPGTAWIAPWRSPTAVRSARATGGPRSPAETWLRWEVPREIAVRRLTLRPATGVRRPTEVRLRAGSAGVSAPVAADGTVALPQPVRGRVFRLDVLAARFPPGTLGRVRQRRAVGIAEVVGTGARATDEPARPGAGGDRGATRLSAPCGLLRVRTGGQILRLRPVGSVATLDAGRPLRVEPCGAPTALPAGRLDVTTESNVLAPYWLRLRSPAPAGLPAPTGGGRVVDPGTLGRSHVNGVRVALDGPSRLVLAEGYDRGWRAWCDGRALGAPEPEAAYGNGWNVDAGCTSVRFAYAPDRVMRIALIVSGGACLLVLALLLLRRPPAPRPEPDLAPFGAVDPPPVAWRRAAGIGIVAGAAGAALIALRAGPPVALAAVLVARYGIGARPLILGAAGLLGIAVPAAYLLFTPDDRGGYAFSYAGELIGAHWLAVAALVLLALVLWRIVSGRRAPAPPPARPAHGSQGRAPAAPDPEPAA